LVIRGLELRNFRRFRHVSLEFPENLVGIIGRNGAGKTTLVEAIAWGLYGTRALTGLGRGRQDKDSLRSAFAADGEPCSVELLFEVGGREYRLIREIRGKAGTVHAQIQADGGRVEADRDSGVSEFVERLVGLDAASFRASVFARQRELAAFTGMRPEERKRTVNRLVGIDLIDRARAQVKSVRRQNVDFADGLRRSLEDLDDLKRSLEEIRTRRKELEAKIEDAERQLAELEVQREAAEKRYDAEQEKKTAYLQLEGEVGKLEAALDQLFKRLEAAREERQRAEAALDELKKLEPELERLEPARQRKEELDRIAAERKRLGDLRSQLEARQRELRTKREQVSKLGGEVARLQEEVAQLESLAARVKPLEETLRALQEQQSKLAEHLGGIKRQGEELRGKRDAIVELGPEGRCPTCRRPLEDHYERVLSELDAELSTLRTSYKEVEQEKQALERQRKTVEAELEEARKALNKLASLESRLKSLQEQSEGLNTDIERLESEVRSLQEALKSVEALEYDEQEHEAIRREVERLQNLQNRASALRSQADRLDDFRRDVENLEAEVSAKKSLLQTKREELTRIGFDEAAFEAAKSNLVQARRGWDAAREELAKLKEARRETLGAMSQIRERIQRQEQLREELKQIQAKIADLETLDVLFDAFRKDLGGRLRPLLEGHTSELVRRTTNGRYVLVSLTSDYDLLLYDQNVPYPLSRFSGGEQDLVNLCFRVAISRVVAERSARNPVNFIVLDEVFGSQDEERRGQILEALQGLSHQFRQIFLITHIESVRDALPVVLEVTEKGPEESVVRVV